MDIAVTRTGRNTWSLADLLGRPLGRIILQEPGKRFIIEPDERGRELMARVNCGAHASLNEALTEIANHTHGTCQLAKGAEDNDC
jgi:hypothetical protein